MEIESGHPIGDHHPLFQVGIRLCRLNDLIVLIDGQTLVTDCTDSSAFDLSGQILPFFLGVRGCHILYKVLTDLHDLRDRLADLGDHLIGHVTGTAVPDVLRRSGYLCRTVLATSSAAV